MFEVLICSLFITLAAAQADAPDAQHGAFADAFARAVECARDLKVDRTIGRLALSPYVQIVEGIPEPAEEDLRVLEEKGWKRDLPSSSLAWLVIARSSRSAPAREILIKQALGGDAGVVLAISFAPPPYSKQMLEEIVPKPVFWGVTSHSLDLLSHIGDRSTLSKLREMRLNESRINVPRMLDNTIRCLEVKLALPEIEQESWTKMGVTYWRAVPEASISVLGERRFMFAAGRLSACGNHFPTSFLRCRAQSGDPLAILLAGEQREATLVEPVRKVAERGGWEGGLAIASLGKIGTDEATEVLAGLAKPGDSIRNRDVSRALSQGNKKAEAVIEKFLQNKDYEESWPLFESALSSLRKRIELEKNQ